MELTIKTVTKLEQLRRCYVIKRKIYTKVCELNAEIAVTEQPIPFAERQQLEYTPIKLYRGWGGLYDCAWLHLTGKLPEGVTADNGVILFNTFSEGALFDETGSPEQGTTFVLGVSDAFDVRLGKTVLDIPKRSLDSGEVDLWLETGNNGLLGKSTGKSRLMSCHVATVNYELKSFYFDYLTCYFMLAGSSPELKKRIRSALNKAFYSFSRNLEKARAALAPILADKEDEDTDAYVIGHSHLDTAWLWPVRETKRKAGRTFANALHNLEKYPEYVFGASQALHYSWIKEYYPTLYERVKDAVKGGRFELLGSMWVEPDINMSGGESIIRQIAYGKDFFKKEFDVDANVCWLPDVFGFSGALPQILKKCGVDYFLTIKLSWNKFNKFPLTSFVWQGIDDSDVIVHMPPEGTYESDAAPYSVKEGAMKSRDKKDVFNAFMVPYGTGDGGGGPGEVNIEVIARERNLAEHSHVVSATSGAFFEKLNAKRDILPQYKGELYLEAHQGTYTSQVQTKLYNRICERLLHKMEYLEALYGCDFNRHDRLWKDVLLQQFHDILPGTSVKLVHDESARDYKETIKELLTYIDELLQNARHGAGVSAINWSPFALHDWRKLGDKWYYCDCAAYSACPQKESVPPADKLTNDGQVMSNGLLTLTFNKRGFITSLKDADGKEYAANGLNKLTIYRDKRMWWNASDMDPFYYKKRIGVMRAVSSRHYTDGAETVTEFTYKMCGTRVKQQVVLGVDKDYVEFRTDIDFKSRLKMLRADFFPSEFGDNAECDIQFGSISRSTDFEQKAQFEVSAHKWVDVSNSEYGTALLSDSRYGFRAKGGMLSMCLVRGTVFPGKRGGIGTHSVRYGFYPHRGDTMQSNVRQRGYAFSYGVELVEGDIRFEPPFTVQNDDIVIETIKPSEKGTIVRLYESGGVAADTEFYTMYDVSECDLLENVISDVSVRSLHFKPFEIKTLLLSSNKEE